LTDSGKGKAEYNQATKKVVITKGDVRIELPGEFDTLEEARTAALEFVERLRAKINQMQ
jgi:hypothetical protein